MKKKHYIYVYLMFCLLLQIALVYFYVIKKINTKELILIGCVNTGVLSVFILNIKHFNKN
ncbi:hypothetical protein SAMN05660862_0912 [Sphingobacterium psychroaquaticum]|uniref:Uncharacterized protein n=1 Tax=Sphingobacterium psychroaquaticum TaxID=561061 RepID=A0A1X7IKX5_9SPHI|nr:hypothetical protein SAMN05660862_0912 [Sphingobacterium psychroaquaticum]